MNLTGKKLGTILMELGLLDADQATAALAYARQWGVPVGRACVKMGFLDAEIVVRALAMQAGAPSVSLAGLEITPEMAAILPKKYAEKHRVVPISVFQAAGRTRPTLVLAATSQRDVGALDELAQATGHRISVVIASDREVEDALFRLYGVGLERHVRAPEEADLEKAQTEVVSDPLELAMEFLPVIDVARTPGSRR